MTCAICRQDIGVDKAKLAICFNCWTMIAKPKNREELISELEARSSLLSALWHRDNKELKNDI